MKIAVCQLGIVWENKEANVSRAIDFIKQASEQKADIILFPEMSFTGFSMNINYTWDKDKGTIHSMQELARENKIAIGFGYVEKSLDMGENHYCLVDKDGNIISDYIKIHPFGCSLEGKYFCGGDKLCTTLFMGRKVSTFICYDLRFPEIFQAVSKEADIILVAANWPESRREHWSCLLRARAIENQSYVIGVNCVGTIDGLDYSGDSAVIAPDGKVIRELSYKEGLIIEDIPDDVNSYRTQFPMKKDRKPEFYKSVL